MLKMAHLSWTIFLAQTIIITFIYLLTLFTVQNFKKFSQRIQSYEDAQFVGPKWPIWMRIFSENLLISLASFIHVYLHPKSDIALLQLKNAEISLAESDLWL